MSEKNSTKKTNTDTGASPLNGMEANLSTLVLSIASSAAMALGLAPNPSTGKTEKDLHLARFNIDLLSVLSDKTKGNRSEDEERFMTSVINDLKQKYVELN